MPLKAQRLLHVLHDTPMAPQGSVAGCHQYLRKLERDAERNLIQRLDNLLPHKIETKVGSRMG